MHNLASHLTCFVAIGIGLPAKAKFLNLLYTVHVNWREERSFAIGVVLLPPLKPWYGVVATAYTEHFIYQAHRPCSNHHLKTHNIPSQAFFIEPREIAD